MKHIHWLLIDHWSKKLAFLIDFFRHWPNIYWLLVRGPKWWGYQGRILKCKLFCVRTFDMSELKIAMQCSVLCWNARVCYHQHSHYSYKCYFSWEKVIVRQFNGVMGLLKMLFLLYVRKILQPTFFYWVIIFTIEFKLVFLKRSMLYIAPLKVIILIRLLFLTITVMYKLYI